MGPHDFSGELQVLKTQLLKLPQKLMFTLPSDPEQLSETQIFLSSSIVIFPWPKGTTYFGIFENADDIKADIS